MSRFKGAKLFFARAAVSAHSIAPQPAQKAF